MKLSLVNVVPSDGNEKIEKLHDGMVGLQKIVLDIAEYVVDSLTEPPLHEGSVLASSNTRRLKAACQERVG